MNTKNEAKPEQPEESSQIPSEAIQAFAEICRNMTPTAADQAAAGYY